MRRRTLLLAVMLVLLLSRNAARAQSSITNQPPIPTLSGGSYRLIMNLAQGNGVLRSDRYQLSPAVPAAGEASYCKSNLPCIGK
jgi:hypothetical protein